MKTRYQKVLALFSGSNKKNYTWNDKIGILDDFLQECKDHFDSGLEVKRIAAIEKLKNIKELIEELQEEKMLPTEEDIAPEEKATYDEMKAILQGKFEKVIESYKKACQEAGELEGDE
ncbi:MAG: hypothetical protein P0S95_02085 [Rhabdochlamydiaceae bacterium]|nr:hypothetical protein [Candidatus Amphrikana amoebophyrae]